MAIDVNELLAPIPGSDPAGSDASRILRFLDAAAYTYMDLKRISQRKKLKSLIQLKKAKNFGSYNLLHYICTYIIKM